MDLKNASGENITAAEWYGVDNPNITVDPGWNGGEQHASQANRGNYLYPPLPPISTAIMSDSYGHDRLHDPSKNPLNGKMWKGNPLGPGQLCNAMSYNRYVPIPEHQGRYICGYQYLYDYLLGQLAQVPGLTNNPYVLEEAANNYNLIDYDFRKDVKNPHRWGYNGGMSCFSKAQALRAQQAIERNKGKCKAMVDYGVLISKYYSDFITDYGGYDAEEIMTALEKYFGTN